MMTRFNYEYDGDFDWVIKKEGRDDQLKALMFKENPAKLAVGMAQTGHFEEHKEVKKVTKPQIAQA